MGILKDDIFLLLPVNDEALWVAQQEANRDYWTPRPHGPGFLAFGPGRSTKKAGRLVTFGRHEKSDIRLPSHPRPTTGVAGNTHTESTAGNGRSYQNYRNDHCFFFLAKSGELILRDLSPCLVHIEIENGTPEENELYALHGNPATGPRQRVIPRTHRDVYITIGASTHFKLGWLEDMVDTGPSTQTTLVANARRLAVPGMTLTPPAHSASHGPRGLYSRELNSRHTPSVGQKPGPFKTCHRYQQLGSGGFGVVYKVVDLSSGELWAVKEINSKRKIGAAGQARQMAISVLRASLIQEVETMAKISHAHIVHYETYQDSRVGGSFQIFYRLYEGSLKHLIHPLHSCREPPPPPAPWVPKMVKQVAIAIEYLHNNGILHLDIKSENILFAYAPGDPQPNFYLGDFGLAVAEADLLRRTTIGTPFSMAPEICLKLDKPCQASDIWSFAITIGNALGFWCPRELEGDATRWANRLEVLGFMGNHRYTEGPELADRQDEAFYRRISAIVATGALPAMFPKMLVDHKHRPTAKTCSNTHVDFFIKRQRHSEPLTDWEGLNAPWLKGSPLVMQDSSPSQAPGAPITRRDARAVPSQTQQQLQRNAKELPKQAAKPTRIPQPTPQRQNPPQQQQKEDKKTTRPPEKRAGQGLGQLTPLPVYQDSSSVNSPLPPRQQRQNPLPAQQKSQLKKPNPKPLLQQSSSIQQPWQPQQPQPQPQQPNQHTQRQRQATQQQQQQKKQGSDHTSTALAASALPQSALSNLRAPEHEGSGYRYGLRDNLSARNPRVESGDRGRGVLNLDSAPVSALAPGSVLGPPLKRPG